jgi:serine/threonine protein phosphatase PrpC
MEKQQPKEKNKNLKRKGSDNIEKKVLETEIPIISQSSKNNSSNLLKISLLDNNEKTLINAFNRKYENYPECRSSQKLTGLAKSVAYNTYKGLSKETNEDRIIVVIPIPKPQKTLHRTWPKMSYFAIFDGHGGENCSEYLKNNFLNILIENKNFPYDIKLALTETFEKIEKDFFNKNKGKEKEEIDKSGSCALVCIMTENKIFIANIGDSRAIMSINNGTKIKQLTVDHKPNNIKEYERVIKNGGKVYIDDFSGEGSVKPDKNQIKYILNKNEFAKYKTQADIIYRHFPSNLAIMRSIGDFKAKSKDFGGLPNNIIAVPEIYTYDYNHINDFIIMGCDGIFDDLSNEEIINTAWYIFKNKAKQRNYDINLLSKNACDLVIKYAMELLTSDNLSCIIIGMEGLQKYLNLKKLKDGK